MPIPDYQTVMLPLLKVGVDRNEHSFREAVNKLADHFKLAEEERKRLFSSGRMAIFDNRVGWALSYLKGSGLLRSTRRGYFEITDRGVAVLKRDPSRLTNDELKRYPEFLEFLKVTKTVSEEVGKDTTNFGVQSNQSADDLLEAGYREIKEKTLQQLLEKVTNVSPEFFEKLALILLRKMGYGGVIPNAGKVTGKSGDGGIDGIINSDALGLDLICYQAKKYALGQTVGSKDIRDFLGALDQNGLTKGIFFTTATFADRATKSESKSGKKVLLIDGKRLAELMFEYDLGVSTVADYKVKKIDSDYFVEDDV